MRKKRVLTEVHKRKIGESLKGKKKIFSEEAIRNIQIAAKKRKGIKTGPRSEEVKKKISEATTGVKKTITKPNSGWFKKGHKTNHSLETRIKIAAANKGKKMPGFINSGSFKKGQIPWNKKEL